MSERTRKEIQKILKDPKKVELAGKKFEIRRERTEAPKKGCKKRSNVVRRSILGNRIYYNCPSCGKLLTFMKKVHSHKCSQCGQKLDWSEYEDETAATVTVNDKAESVFWLEKYEQINERTFGVDMNDWLAIKKKYPMELYFFFENRKNYGKFIREMAKEGVETNG